MKGSWRFAFTLPYSTLSSVIRLREMGHNSASVIVIVLAPADGLM